jgi:ABC-type multidrug transport system permease subunit
MLRVGVSALLALPFILVGMPARAQAAGLVMVVLFTAFFGAAVGHVRLREDGRLERLLLLPMWRVTLWLDLALASALSRSVPAAVVLTGFVAVNGRNVRVESVVALAGLLSTTLVLLTLLGMGVARLARSNAEVHLFGALAGGLLAVVSGVVPLPERLAGVSVTTAWNPIGRLTTTLVELSRGSQGMDGAELAVTVTTLAVFVAVAAVRWVQGAGPRGRI